jgi:elongation factor P
VALSITDLKSGVTIFVDGEVYQIIESQHVKPGKGAAFCRTKLRNMRSDNVLEMTFRGETKIDEAFIEERKLQYLYVSGDSYVFMDNENFEELQIHKDLIGEKVKFLKDNLNVVSLSYKNEILSVNLPNFIVYKIVSVEPGIKGDTAKSGTKPAKIETGAIVNVPLFVDENDEIKVDIRTGTYVERVVK